MLSLADTLAKAETERAADPKRSLDPVIMQEGEMFAWHISMGNLQIFATTKSLLFVSAGGRLVDRCQLVAAILTSRVTLASC